MDTYPRRDWEQRAYRDAHGIAVVGASNPSGVAHTLYKLITQARATGMDAEAISTHPALQGIAGHLAFLFGQGIGPSFEALNAITEQERRRETRETLREQTAAMVRDRGMS